MCLDSESLLQEACEANIDNRLRDSDSRICEILTISTTCRNRQLPSHQVGKRSTLSIYVFTWVGRILFECYLLGGVSRCNAVSIQHVPNLQASHVSHEPEVQNSH